MSFSLRKWMFQFQVRTRCSNNLQEVADDYQLGVAWEAVVQVVQDVSEKSDSFRQRLHHLYQASRSSDGAHPSDRWSGSGVHVPEPRGIMSSKKRQIRKELGHDRHHLVPRSRLKQGVPPLPDNLLWIEIERHRGWHMLWGNRTLDEVLELLQRLKRAKSRTRQ